MTDTKKQAKIIRIFRWVHRKLAIALFVFFLLISITGILLGIKKNTGLLAPTQKGISSDQSTWLPVDSLTTIALAYLHDSVSADLSPELDRIDIRPGKGIAKYIFKNHYTGLQLDCASGKVLSVEKRKSDFIEDLHDGSILDDLFGTKDEPAKISYTLLMGVSLLMLVVSGFWLWYGPKVIRRKKRAAEKS